MRTLLPISFLLLPLPAAAQGPLPRPEGLLSSFATVRGQAVATAAEKLPATVAGTVATAKLAVAAWIERPSSSNLDEIRVARSLDGGRTWTVPATVYTAVAGERLASVTNDAASGVKLAIGASTVFVGYTSDKGRAGNADREDVFLLASGDQGQTWAAELLVNTVTTGRLRDAEELALYADRTGVCHLVYEHDVAGGEDIFYASAQLTGAGLQLVTAETRLQKGIAPGVFDADSLAVAGDYPIVAVTWRDDRIGAGLNEIFAITSIQNGADFANPSVVEQRVSNNGAVGAPRRSVIAVAGASVYVAWEDSRTAGPTVPGFDEVYCAVSSNGGVSFTEHRVNDSAVGSADVDNVVIAARGSTVVLTWEDDRNARPFGLADFNWGDDIYVVVDRNRGAGFATGVANARLDTLSPNDGRGRSEQPQIALADRYIGVCWEESWNNGGTVPLTNEDLALAVSRDDGTTWQAMRFGTNRGSAFVSPGTDISDPAIAITRNHDLIMGYLDSDLGGRSMKMSSLKLPEFESRATGAANLRVSGCRDTDTGSFALVLVTNNLASTPLPLDPLGFEPIFAIGSFTPLFLEALPLFSGIVPGDGSLAFPAAPDFGGQFRAVALGIDLTTFQFSWFSDPVAY